MLNLDVSSRPAPRPESNITLWHCDQCDAFVSIHSAHALDEAFCPACGDRTLEYCGRLSCMPGIEYGNA